MPFQQAKNPSEILNFKMQREKLLKCDVNGKEFKWFAAD